MYFIPKLRIKKEAELSAIRENQKLHSLPSEVIEEIISFIGNEIDMNNVDDFWISLGIDTCNMVEFANYVFKILYISHKSKVPSYIWQLGEAMPDGLFHQLRCSLETLYYTNYRSGELSYGDWGPFFKTDNIVPYPIPEPTDSSKIFINSQDKKYIETFIKKTKSYLDYLKKNMHRIPMDLRVWNRPMKEIKQQKKIVINFVNKIEKSINKLSNKLCKINIQD